MKQTNNYNNGRGRGGSFIGRDRNSNTFGRDNSNTFGRNNSNTFGRDNSNTFGRDNSNTFGRNNNNTFARDNSNTLSEIEQKWENPLSQLQKKYYISRFQNENIKLSYETVAPKKVLSSEYNLCIAIPYGKKAYIWYTFCNNSPICLLLELNRDNQISDNISIFTNSPSDISTDFELGTIISGTLYEEIEETEIINPNANSKIYFVMDDIHMYKGITISKWCFEKKTGFIYDFLSKNTQKQIVLSVLCNSETNIILNTNISYNIRHIQYRATKEILPHYNVSCNKKPLWNPVISANINTNNNHNHNKVDLSKKIINTNWKYDFSKPIYKRNAFFWVKADLAYDVYFLGALSLQNDIIYCQNALILNFKTSVLLNTIFRNIRENQCLDIIEESDDEMEFEDVREDKFVYLEKECIMECYFHFKFKKWIPLCVVSTEDYKNKIISLPSLL